ncbi:MULTISPECIES: antitermination protein N [Enterobacteriaceae]|uniref:antitermination protein N n=1 Tax=Enterobacteriaceae TaxID=543 RepID=UPI000272B2DC|nr:antitermination protein N [Enterobacter sp. Ag1]EJF31733.1 bacteriophage protein [Enterobacter sp. Ag1]
MDSQARRRERRGAKQAEWKAANPLLVGVSAKPGRQVLTLNRTPMPRPEKATQEINKYGVQIINAAKRFSFEQGKAASKLIQRHQKVLNEANRQIHAVQKQRGKSIPLI